MKKILVFILVFISVQFVFSQESEKYFIKNININDTYSNFGISFFNDDKVFFSSPKKTNTGVIDLYFGFIDEYGDVVKIETMPNKINSNHDEMDVAFTSDFKTVYFTRKTNRKHLDLYKADVVTPNQWKNIKRLPFNRPKKSFGYPCLSADNKTLYFSSNKIGPMGQFDIFKVALLGKNKYGKVEVLGQNVNTLEDETTPYIVNDTLYFSSKGRGGLGGYDIFSISLKDKNAIAKNLGEPINSTEDDYAYVKRKNAQIGFFTSKRKNGKGNNDIYSFQKIIEEELIVEDSKPAKMIDFLAEENKKIAAENERIAIENEEIARKNKRITVVATEEELKKNALIVKENERLAKENDAIVKANEALKKEKVLAKETRDIARAKREQKDKQELARRNRERYNNEKEALRKKEELTKRDREVALAQEVLRKKEELAKRDREVALAQEVLRKKEELAKRDREVALAQEVLRKKEELAKRDREVALAQEALRKKEELAKRDREVALAQEALRKKEELAKRDREVALAQEALRKKEELAKRDREVALAQEVLRKKEELAKRDRELALAQEALRKKEELAKRDREVALAQEVLRKKEELAKRDRELALADEVLRRKEELATRKDNEVIVINKDLKNFEEIANVILVNEIEKPKTKRNLNLKEKECESQVSKLEDIYFDLNKFNIRFDAAIQLNVAIMIMVKCPNATFIASSHTDSTGKSEYNRALSQKRATAVVDYILKYSNLDINRFKGIGYGETQLKNRCANGVECSKEEHQVNRRNELEIIFN